MGPTKRVPAGKSSTQKCWLVRDVFAPKWFFVLQHTDGWFRNPANSPVEVGRLTQGFSSIPGGEPSTALTKTWGPWFPGMRWATLVEYHGSGYPGDRPTNLHRPPPTSAGETGLESRWRIIMKFIKKHGYSKFYSKVYLPKAKVIPNRCSPNCDILSLSNTLSHMCTYIHICAYDR